MNDEKCGLKEIQLELIQRDKQEVQDIATQASETLKSLKVSIGDLPLRCQQLLHTFVSLQNELNMTQFDPISTSLSQTKLTSKYLKQEYEVLELKQDNLELRKKIERNDKILEGLRKDLECSRSSLNNQMPNPENIDQHLRQTKQKLISYEEIYEKAKAKFTKLQVPESLLLCLNELTTQVDGLKSEEQKLKQRADDITLARDALQKLRELDSYNNTSSVGKEKN